METMSSARAVSDPSPAPPPVPATPSRGRLDSVDVVRGLVMVIMALDHVRDFFSSARFDPLDLTRTSAALYATRWVTHFCAPIFVFLAGTGTYLSAMRGKPKKELSWFLVTRGLWLVLLEVTVVNIGWTFDLGFHFTALQVIWVIGISMVALAALVWLPTAVVAAFGIVMILGHNLLDPIKPDRFGEASWLWKLVHVQGGTDPLPGHNVFIVYPLVPWVGVMAAGYAFGALYRLESARRKRLLVALGAGALLLVPALRLYNVYGDPRPWTFQARGTAFTLMSFFNFEKYPPSLLYLCATLGPALLLLALLDGREARGASKPLVVFGRVPLFYYLLHVPLIHVMAGVYAVSKYGVEKAARIDPFNLPPGYGFSLAGVYAVWALTVLLLYPPCAWFARLKARRKDAWLSYL